METAARKAQIVDAAMRRFAEHGYRNTRVEDIAREVGVAKGTVFLHFGSKEGLFLAVYEHAVGLLPRWLDAPADIVGRGFWSVLEYWLENAEDLMERNHAANRVTLIGRYDSGLALHRPIARFLRSEDPYGTLEFIEFGVDRGDLRSDVDVEMLASMLEWAGDRFQDALASEEFDPGLVRRRQGAPDRRAERIREFLEVLRNGIGGEADGSGRGRAVGPVAG
jgi:AcrR family transcriptional regulator